MPFKVEGATSEDAAAIAKIFVSDDESDFNRLQLGTVDLATFDEGMTKRIREGIEKADQVYIVARDQETDEIVSYAQWVLPKDVIVKTTEEKAREIEQFRGKLMPGMNEPLMIDFKKGVDDLKGRVLQGKKHFMLGNIGTLPSYRRRGAASALASWPLEKADNEQLLVYLDTNETGNARRMYERLGFECKDAVVFDLRQYGGVGTHSHCAMVREPRSSS